MSSQSQSTPGANTGKYTMTFCYHATPHHTNTIRRQSKQPTPKMIRVIILVDLSWEVVSQKSPSRTPPLDRYIQINESNDRPSPMLPSHSAALHLSSLTFYRVQRCRSSHESQKETKPSKHTSTCHTHTGEYIYTYPAIPRRRPTNKTESPREAHRSINSSQRYPIGSLILFT